MSLGINYICLFSEPGVIMISMFKLTSYVCLCTNIADQNVVKPKGS